MSRREQHNKAREYVEPLSSGTESEGQYSWVGNHCSAPGNEYFCVVDTEFILDRFNLTGLGHEMAHAQKAYELIAYEGIFICALWRPLTGICCR